MRKLIKIISLFIISLLIIFLVKNNVKAIKAKPTDSKDSYSVLNLDLNSKIVMELYEGLDLDLINDNCDYNCLTNSNYNYLYFQFEGKEKVLDDDEKLYLAFNSMMKKGLLTSNVNNEKETLTISESDVQKELEVKFNIKDFKSFENTFKRSNECGIIDYLYTGTCYELTFVPCLEKPSLGFSKLISAQKEGNYINLLVTSFKAYQDKKRPNIYNVSNYEDKTIITTSSYDELNNNLEDIFKSNEFNVYTFTFELVDDNYYLRNITK